VPQCDQELRRGQWNPLVGRQLTGRTIGIIGCGHVGKELVGLLTPFGCRILANDIRDYAAFYDAHGVEPVSLLHLLRECEIVTLHVPLDATTRGMIGAREIAQMRTGAVLINAARGGLVDEAAVRASLLSGQLAGAAFDVFNQEPPADRALLELPTFLGTPHIGGSSEEAQLAMGRAAIDGLETARLVDDSWPQ
jgi:D-3-phosphoglycerate dehydrogenase